MSKTFKQMAIIELVYALGFAAVALTVAATTLSNDLTVYTAAFLILSRTAWGLGGVLVKGVQQFLSHKAQLQPAA